MVPANKILTVTYGTFSCTLEGFDDPFSAMTEIAEYFRDLAAKDRYFGAEPPTPDMERLEQIAASKTTGPVKGDTSSGRLVLRPDAGTAVAGIEDAVTAEGVEDDAAPSGPFAPGGVAETDLDHGPADHAEHEDEIADDATEVDASEPDADLAESVAARLARLRDAAVEETAEDFEIEDSLDGSEAEAEAETPEPALDDVAAVTPVAPEAEPVVAEDASEQVDDLLADAEVPADEDASQIDGSVEDEPIEAGDAEIDDDEMAAETGDRGVDEDVVAIPVEDAAGAVSAVETDPPTLDSATQDDGDVVAEDDETIVAEADEDASAEVDVMADAEPDATTEAGKDVATEGGEDAADEAGPEVEIEDDDASLTDDLAALFSPREDEEDGEERDQAVAEPSPEPRVTVRKVRRRDRVSRRPAAEETAAPAAALEDEEEADLMAELAAIEAELARDATGADMDEADEVDEESSLASELDEIEREAAEAAPDPEDAPSVEPEVAAAADGDASDMGSETADAPESFAEQVEDAEEVEEAEAGDPEPSDLERLFAATDSRLSGEDASRRHANISHLKAAVAARRADDTIEPAKADNSDAYREDLANTVRPRRPAAEDGAEASRPERGSPLVLISEQRVEPDASEAEESDATPKPPEKDIAEGLPRGMPAPANGDDFEQFAEEVGAVDLADVLEAAAVFSGTVMGQETFSRPRLLHLAAEAVDDLSREDGLRGFGQLLRDGTIRKVGRGTFTLGTESRFQARAQRRAG